MAYQYKREPLSIEESDRMLAAAKTVEEKLCVWGLLETGLWLSELADIKRDQIQWQQRTIRIKGKGGPYGKLSKFRVVPISNLLMPLLQHYFAIQVSFSKGVASPADGYGGRHSNAWHGTAWWMLGLSRSGRPFSSQITHFRPRFLSSLQLFLLAIASPKEMSIGKANQVEGNFRKVSLPFPGST